jgi:hypothetical protein
MRIEIRSVACASWLAALGVALAIGGAPARALAGAAYPTSEAAAEAFRAALDRGDDGSALLELLGTENREELVGGDPAAARQGLAELRDSAHVALKPVPQSDGSVVLYIGAQAWPMPVPLVKDDQGWRFDVAAGLEEITDRRIGRNELSAIELCRAYATAQLEYARADRDGDEVLEYAQRLESSEGAKDGLHWADPGGDDPSPLGEFAAAAEEYLGYRKQGEPFHGYRFRVLTAQGATPPGGRYGYVINGNMIAGHALIGWPAEYGRSGIMSFLVNQQGRVFQRDLGPDTNKAVEAMREYEPGDDWVEVED